MTELQDVAMLELLKDTTKKQYEAALSTLNRCIHCCPAGAWHTAVAELRFCQAVFHALFYTDLYLDRNDGSFQHQEFHQLHKDNFRDYEELADRCQQHTYEKPFILDYVQHCHEKVLRVVGAETAESLQRRTSFEWIDTTRAELHLYNIRHIQHHAAQLILCLRLKGPREFPWHKTGWLESP